MNVWATNFVGYTSSSFNLACPNIACSCDNPSCTASQCNPVGNACEGVGDIIVAPFAGTLQSISFYTTPATCAPATCGLPNQFVILTAPAGSLVHISTPSGYCPTGGPGTTCGKEGAGDVFTIADVEGMSGLTAGTFTTILLAGTVTVTTGQYVAIILQSTANEGLTIGQTMSQCPCFTTVYAAQIIFGTVTSGITCPPGTNGTPVVGNQACSDVGPTGPPIVGGSFVPSSSPITQITSCFGNCGSPPITLANTNSTHSIAFNQTITLFYQFQVQNNGFLLNVTTSVAKNYINGQVLFIGGYVSNCGLGSTPFTAQCPGILKAQTSITNPTKGKQSMISGLNGFQVTQGQWVGIAVSGLFSPLDLNDTNTTVQLYQTSGTVPSVIQANSIFSTGSLVGIWAWVVGNTVSAQGPGPVTSICTNNFAQLDCILPALSNGSCAVLTASCQTSGSLLWVVILSLLVFLVATVGMSSAHITRFIGAGELFMFLFLAWFFIFAGIGLIQSFVVVMFLFVGSVAFGKSVRNYF